MARNTKLRSLKLGRNSLGPASVRCLAPGLSAHVSLEALNLSLNDIGDEGAKSIAMLVLSAPNSKLKQLILRGCGIRADGLQAILNELEENTSLQELDLSCCYHVKEEAFENVSSKNTHLKLLVLQGCLLEGHGLKALTCWVYRYTALESLSLAGNYFDTSDMRLLGNMLKETTTLTDLDLSQNGLHDDCIVQLAPGLGCNSSLVNLDLSTNDVGNDGACALAKAMQSPCRFGKSVKRLDLGLNDIGTLGVESIVESLSRNPMMEKLSLHWNPIGSEGGKAIASMLKTNRTLKKLQLGSCRAMRDGGVDGIHELASCLKENSTREELELFDIGNKEALALVDGLTSNTGLRSVGLSVESHGLPGLVAICKLCSTEMNTSIKQLKIFTVGRLGVGGESAIVDLVRHNTSLETFHTDALTSEGVI